MMTKRFTQTMTAFVIAFGITFAFQPNEVRAQEPFIAEIKMFGGNFAPRGFAFLDGQLLPISNNQALFSLLGTTYGGDGRTTFALPDLRGRVPVHPGTGPGLPQIRLGQRGGTSQNSLTVLQLAPHSHTGQGTVRATSAPGAVSDPSGAIQAAEDRTDIYLQGPPDVDMQANNVTLTIASAGGGQPIDNMQPFLGINFIIAMVGIFPSRN